MADIGFGEQPKTAVFTLFGHPGIWSSPSRDEGETLQVKGLEYTTYTFERNVEELLDYNPEYHLLLDAQAQQITWSDGSRAEFREREGTSADFPRDLKGISGGPVWRTGDLNVPIDDWHRLPPRVVGVQTGAVRRLLHSPTGDAITPPAFWPSR
jgi:hypothetical protein